MSNFSRMFQRLTSFMSTSKQASDKHSTGSHLDDPDGMQLGLQSQAYRVSRATGQTENKRKAQKAPEKVQRKRLKQNGGTPTWREDEETLPETDVSPDGADRERMPPPATPRRRAKAGKLIQSSMALAATGLEDIDADTASEISRTTNTASRRRQGHSDQYDMERARRRAAATRLPEKSGIWARGEQELFYHFALRGFEPLLPHNWIPDFKTLPLSLYAQQHSEELPVIYNIHGTEFRGVRALQKLIETGKEVRDKSLSSPGFRTESVLERAVNRYIKWAVRDARVDNNSTIIPVHCLVKRKAGQSTADTLAVLTEKLHNLAIKYRRKRGIYSSIESRDLAPTDNDETQVCDEGDGLPVLTGILIVSSVLVVFTLNAHTPAPASMRCRRDSASSTSTYNSPSRTAEAGTQSPEDAGLRFIATFDFSDPAQDVWHALAVAILAMHIRKMILESLTDDDLETMMQLDHDESSRIEDGNDDSFASVCVSVNDPDA